MREHLKNAPKTQPKPKATSSLEHLKKEKEFSPRVAKNNDGIQTTSYKATESKTNIKDKAQKPSEPAPPPIPTANVLRKNHWCSGNCPEEYKSSCGFRNALVSLRYPNASGKLRANLKEAHTSIYNVVENISKAKNFSIAHHHLIPGNECYGKMDGEHYRYELLVKLGYFFDYDINNAENGILLPASNNSATESISLNATEITKAEYYYQIMDLNLRNNTSVKFFPSDEHDFVGSQLHLGQHTYEKNLITLKKLYPNARKLRSYESIVITELDRLNNFYMDKYEETCFMKDYKTNQKEFFKHMKAINSRLRKGINQFPHEDKEFSFLNKRIYVSFPAILYDMNISVREYQETYPKSKDIWKVNKKQKIQEKLVQFKAKRGETCANTISLPPRIQKAQIISTSTKHLSRKD